MDYSRVYIGIVMGIKEKKMETTIEHIGVI